MAKAKPPEDVILDSVRKALDALPHLLPLKGTKSLFSAKQGELADRAVSEGYFTKREASVAGGKGKKTSPIVYAVVTEMGARKVAESGGSQNLEKVLQLLHSAIGKIGTPPTPPDPVAFQTAIEKATVTCVDTINTAFAKLHQDVLRSLTVTEGAATDPGPVLAGITAALRKIEPTVVKVPVLTETAPASPTPGPPVTRTTDPTEVITDEVIAFVGSWTREKNAGCQFDVLMNHLRQLHPALTIGNFQDTLRKLYESEKLRLTGWPKMLDDLPEPELALFVSSKVMYYAQLAQHRS